MFFSVKQVYLSTFNFKEQKNRTFYKIFPCLLSAKPAYVYRTNRYVYEFVQYRWMLQVMEKHR